MDTNQTIARLGGATQAARTLGLSTTTVHSWLRRGNIPEWRRDKVEAALTILDRANGAKKTGG